MERKMNKAERQLSPEAAMDALRRGDHGTLSMNGDDGFPYATPINYVMVGDTVYMHCAPHGYRIDCLKRDPKICFSVITQTQIIPSKITASFESVILTGKAVLVEDEGEKRTAMEAFVTQKHPGYEEIGFKMIEKQLGRTAVIKLVPDAITGKAYKG